MDPVWGRVAVVVNLLAYILIRWPHGNRLKTLEVHESRCGCPEALRLSWATLGTTVLPLLWALSGMLNFADYALHPVVFAIGNASSLIGHWLFFRSHRDLGTYWSPTLQVRENHQLITSGIYTRIRHPMYAAMMMQGVGQALFLPNWIAGPAWLVTFGTLYLFRVGEEERMMLDHFGEEYASYMKTTGRLLPRLRRTPSP